VYKSVARRERQRGVMNERWRRDDRYPEGFSGQSFFGSFFSDWKNELGSQTNILMVHVEREKTKKRARFL